MTLIEFLLARIEEDEQPTWELAPPLCAPGCCYPIGFVGHLCLICDETSYGGTPEAITAIAEEHDEKIHRRARVLAECATKRALIEIHSCAPSLGDGDDVCFECQLTYPCSTLLILVAPWQLHQDFDPSWLPSGVLGDH